MQEVLDCLTPLREAHPADAGLLVEQATIAGPPAEALTGHERDNPHFHADAR